MPHPKIKISDNSGNTVAVDTSGASNALKVALVAGASIDIGDVEILGHSTVVSYQNTLIATIIGDVVTIKFQISPKIMMVSCYITCH